MPDDLRELVERHDAQIFGRHSELPGLVVRVERLEHHEQTRRRTWAYVLVVAGGLMAAVASAVVGWIVGAT